jgi:hypothetical protein
LGYASPLLNRQKLVFFSLRIDYLTNLYDGVVDKGIVEMQIRDFIIVYKKQVERVENDLVISQTFYCKAV